MWYDQVMLLKSQYSHLEKYHDLHAKVEHAVSGNLSNTTSWIHPSIMLANDVKFSENMSIGSRVIRHWPHLNPNNHSVQQAGQSQEHQLTGDVPVHPGPGCLVAAVPADLRTDGSDNRRSYSTGYRHSCPTPITQSVSQHSRTHAGRSTEWCAGVEL